MRRGKRARSLRVIEFSSLKTNGSHLLRRYLTDNGHRFFVSKPATRRSGKINLLPIEPLEFCVLLPLECRSWKERVREEAQN